MLPKVQPVLQTQNNARVTRPLHRRLDDLLLDAEFLLVQLVMLHRSGGPHLVRERGRRLAELHRRLDGVERELRAHGSTLGLDAKLTLSELRRQLAAFKDRRLSATPYAGRERRRAQRRTSDRL